MRATFVETTGFTAAIVELLTDAEYAQLQLRLMANPAAGSAMPGCGGLRKVRVADSRRNKGKRSGARIIYLHVPMASRFYMLDVFGKNEKDDLSTMQKRILRRLANRLRSEVLKGNRQEPRS